MEVMVFVCVFVVQFIGWSAQKLAKIEKSPSREPLNDSPSNEISVSRWIDSFSASLELWSPRHDAQCQRLVYTCHTREPNEQHFLKETVINLLFKQSNYFEWGLFRRSFVWLIEISLPWLCACECSKRPKWDTEGTKREPNKMGAKTSTANANGATGNSGPHLAHGTRAQSPRTRTFSSSSSSATEVIGGPGAGNTPGISFRAIPSMHLSAANESTIDRQRARSLSAVPDLQQSNGSSTAASYLNCKWASPRP